MGGKRKGGVDGTDMIMEDAEGSTKRHKDFSTGANERIQVAEVGPTPRREMNLLSWNCQGMGNPSTVNALRSWCWRDRPNIVFVMETMISYRELMKARKKCGFVNGLCLIE